MPRDIERKSERKRGQVTKIRRATKIGLEQSKTKKTVGSPLEDQLGGLYKERS